jgi:ABC-2 type transport system permease protein
VYRLAQERINGGFREPSRQRAWTDGPAAFRLFPVMNRWHAFQQMVLTRLREFYREPIALFWVYVFPTLLAVLLGVAFAGGEQPVPEVDVQGRPDQSDARDLAEYLRKKGLKVEVRPEEEASRRLNTGKVALVVAPTPKGTLYKYDPTRPDAVSALYQVESLLLRKDNPKSPEPTLVKVDEPGNRYIDFLVPGLLGLNLMGGGMWGVGFVLVDMRVRKLLKRLVATPMNRGDFLMAILTARLVFLLPDMVLLLLVGILGFGVPVRGSFVVLGLVILVGSFCFAGIGMVTASRAEKAETVTGLMNLVMLPQWLLSGTFFSSERFPDAVQPFIQALPLTQLNNAFRDVMLEGKGLDEMGWRLLVLLAWGAASFFLALKWFRWR